MFPDPFGIRNRRRLGDAIGRQSLRNRASAREIFGSFVTFHTPIFSNAA